MFINDSCYGAPQFCNGDDAHFHTEFIKLWRPTKPANVCLKKCLDGCDWVRYIELQQLGFSNILFIILIFCKIRSDLLEYLFAFEGKDGRP